MTSPVYTVNCSILLTEHELHERPAAAREAGFDAVEFWWPFSDALPRDSEVEAFARAIEDAGVHLSGLNFAAGDMPNGDRGLLSHPDRSSEFRDSVDVAVGIATRLGTKAFNALYGNRRDEISAAAQDDTAVENLAYAARAVQPLGAVVLIEPVSGAERYPLKRADDAVAVIDRVARETAQQATNLRLLADLYHLSVNGDEVAGALDRHADRIGHVQIADSPGRGQPGTGSLPIDQYLDQLAANGYHGYVGLEYKATQTDAFAWLPHAQRASTARAER